jgi:tetratricopeptide (TPR) repeat protein
MYCSISKTYRPCILAFFFLAQLLVLNGADAQETQPLFGQLEEAMHLRYENPEYAEKLLEEVHETALRQGDTTLAIKALLEMPYVYGQHVDYAKSYDALWLALLLADDIHDQKQKATAYGHLGRLYSYYKRKKEAFEYLQTSLDINKDLVNKGLLDKTYLVNNYYLISTTYRELGNPGLGRIYLDSCFMNHKAVQGQIAVQYLQFEKAFNYSQENKYKEALELMKRIEPWFIENRPSYLVLVYTYWGDIFTDISQFEESEKKYQEALQISEKYNSHFDFTPLIFERLADIYLNKGDTNQSLTYLQKAKELDSQFFDSRSERNKSLLEIKDEFRLEQERQEKLIQKQRLAQLEQQDKISLLQRIILLGTLIFLIIIGFGYVKYLRSKHKTEKQMIRRNKELEIQKAEELLELKNKELAASALQLVEKEEFLRELKLKLKSSGENVKSSEIKQVIRSISVNNQNNWEEFKLRFTAVNEKFYNKITNEYPNLTQADQRICALIKLNFSSKEMARLLGISVESVHTTRYRLRKKIGLPRSANLEDFIAAL